MIQYRKYDALNLLEQIIEHVEEDRVTADDDRAINAANMLRYYIVDHMDDEDFLAADDG